jgi:two-component system NarL family response regulator
MGPTGQLNPSRPLRVVIADDHAFYREGLAQHLRESGIDVVGEAADGEGAIRKAAETAPDVVIMDLSMPGLSGLDATRRLFELAPASRVLVLSVSDQEADVTEAILAGASGYVLKEVPVEEVVERIRAAAEGRPLISAPVAAVLLRRASDAEGTNLSNRELAVLSLLAGNKTDREIAGTLSVSPRVVREDMSSILRKLR